MSLAIVERLERLDLAAAPAQQLRAAVKAAIETNFVLFPLLSAELRAKIIEACLDNFFVQRGRKVQFLSGDGGDSFTQLPVTAFVNCEWRAETLRGLMITTIPGLSRYTGERELAPTVVNPAGDLFFLRAGFYGAYPAWARVMLSEAQKVAVPASTVLAKREYHSGAVKQALAPGGILSGLKEVYVVATMNLDPVMIEINLKQKAFLDFVKSRLFSFASTDKYVVGPFMNRYAVQPVSLVRAQREMYLALEDDEAWASLVGKLSPIGAQMAGGNAGADSFQAALEYKRFCALYEWQETLEPKLEKIAEQCGIKAKMVGTIKVVVTQQYWEDPYQNWAPYGFRPLF
ncbi:hypothetical protein KJ359_000773 [Pestalotiopsis sp. 9143b]|nr:hypothetical protein KJ359_000773 [Pestalotiopsis sp. 9143b]